MSMLDLTARAAAPAKPSQFATLLVVSIALFAVILLWGTVDDRMLNGVPVWTKPLKFALSFVVLFATIVLIERRMSEPARGGWTMRMTGWVMAAAFLSEMAYIMYQSARAEASHFNLSTPFTLIMYSVVMATGAVCLVIAVAVIGWRVKRDKAADITPELREAIWLGCLMTFVLTMIVAGYMSSTMTHFVGLHPDGAPTLPLVGWSGVTGDMRPAHFASLHAMQILPLFVLLMEQVGQKVSARAIRIAGAAYTALTLALFAQALMGYPLFKMGNPL